MAWLQQLRNEHQANNRRAANREEPLDEINNDHLDNHNRAEGVLEENRQLVEQAIQQNNENLYRADDIRNNFQDTQYTVISESLASKIIHDAIDAVNIEKRELAVQLYENSSEIFRGYEIEESLKVENNVAKSLAGYYLHKNGGFFKKFVGGGGLYNGPVQPANLGSGIWDGACNFFKIAGVVGKHQFTNPTLKGEPVDIRCATESALDENVGYGVKKN